jgi:hypothetical protein
MKIPSFRKLRKQRERNLAQCLNLTEIRGLIAANENNKPYFDVPMLDLGGTLELQDKGYPLVDYSTAKTTEHPHGQHFTRIYLDPYFSRNDSTLSQDASGDYHLIP